MEENLTIKKKLMFAKGDDFYFLSYNMILILHSLKCICGQRKFTDYRKLAFLIDFVSNRNLAFTLEKPGYLLNPVDREQFTRAYANGLIRVNQISRLLFTLEKKQVVILSRDDGGIMNVCLKKESLNATFLDKKLFRFELDNLKTMTAHVQRLNVLSLETLLERLFDNHGIKRWVNY